MTSYVPIYNDVVNQVLVTGLTNPASWVIPRWKKASLVRLKYFPLLPTNTGRAPYYSQADISGLSLRIQIGTTGTILAYQDTWTKQVAADATGYGNYFYADLDLNTTELNTAIGASAAYQTKFEIQLSDNGWRTVYQSDITIDNYVRDPTGAADLPDPADAYLTKAQAAGQYVSFSNNANGAAIVLKSQDGSKEVMLYIDNDGVFHADPVS